MSFLCVTGTNKTSLPAALCQAASMWPYRKDWLDYFSFSLNVGYVLMSVKLACCHTGVWLKTDMATYLKNDVNTLNLNNASQMSKLHFYFMSCAYRFWLIWWWRFSTLSWEMLSVLVWRERCSRGRGTGCWWVSVSLYRALLTCCLTSFLNHVSLKQLFSPDLWCSV